jgi:beta-glucanase (GH16 family)
MATLLCCASLVACTTRDGDPSSDDVFSPSESTRVDGSVQTPDAAPPLSAPDASTPLLDGSAQSPRDAGNGAPQADGGGPVADAATDAGKPDAASDASAADAGRAADLPGYRLVFQDEFDGPEGQKADAKTWTYETGGTGWGNSQLEFDTDRAENAALNGMGQLEIVARKESYMGKSYTSARLRTQGKFEHSYGRYEARMRIPDGQGVWPAFWMLGADIGSASWPSCGEIDIMESIGRERGMVHGTLHGPGYSGGNGVGAAYTLPNNQNFADDFHVLALEWEEDAIRWYVDGKLYQTRTPKDLPSGARWVFDHNFFILLNLAIGGQWPGNPDASTAFPRTLSVDYVRVYERL